ncbi:MAG: tRNA (uridine(54)-C5)-methyltransferase TrmA [Helicobacteraceae bacterium]|jgi:tRNA (uracil-5-)-methyltransferase|nr:tRNA (uridine(54)-C5)-methyltransferase TrmA [Helicobacteraceae bacterium]
MICEWFGECGGCALPIAYDEQLARKKEAFLDIFSGIDLPKIEFFESEKSHFRNRGEFRVWHEADGGISLSMFKKKSSNVISVSRCPATHSRFYENAQDILNFIADFPVLFERLFELDFLVSTDGKDMILTLIYHKKIDERWEEAAGKLRERFNGRSRGEKLVIGDDFITEGIEIKDRRWRYMQKEGAFSQPNGRINREMIDYLSNRLEPSQNDYLELYCGNGNFTLPLSQKIDKAIAIEINRESLNAAKQNAIDNSCDNIFFARMSAEEFANAMNKTRSFNRLKELDLDEYNFDAALVDPPRSGLDPNSLNLISGIDRIIYISCNPKTLRRDIETLNQTHAISSLALFDQFPYTHHIETCVILEGKQC